jgi:hypothetical protein
MCSEKTGAAFLYGMAPDGLYFALVETTGNIWLAEPQGVQGTMLTAVHWQFLPTALTETGPKDPPPAGTLGLLVGSKEKAWDRLRTTVLR